MKIGDVVGIDHDERMEFMNCVGTIVECASSVIDRNSVNKIIVNPRPYLVEFTHEETSSLHRRWYKESEICLYWSND